MAGRGLPLKTDTAISRIPQVTGSGQAQIAQANAFARIADAAATIGEGEYRKEEQERARQAAGDFSAKAQETPSGTAVAVPQQSGWFGYEGRLERSYNNMIEALSVDRAKKDVTQAAAKFRAEKFGDVAGFEQSMDAWRSTYMKGALPEVAVEIQTVLDSLIADGAGSVLQDRINADVTEARSGMVAEIESLASQLETMMAAGAGETDPEAVASLSKQLQDRMTTRVRNPLYGYSDMEGELDAAALRDRLLVAGLVPEVRRIYEAEGYAAALEGADEMVLSLGRDQAATVAMRSRLQGEVNVLHQITNAKQEAAREKEIADAKALEARGTALDQRATRIIHDPNSSLQDRVAAVNDAAPYITGSRYGELYNKAMKGPGGDDDEGGRQFAMLMQLARQGDLSPDEAFEAGLGLNGSQLNQILAQIDSRNNEDLKAGYEILSGAFARGGMLDAVNFSSLAAAESEAGDELRRWYEKNPEASVNDITTQARVIAGRRGRQQAVILLAPSLNNLPLEAGNMSGVPTIAQIDAQIELLQDRIAALPDTTFNWQRATLPPGASSPEPLTRELVRLLEVKRLLELSNGPG